MNRAQVSPYDLPAPEKQPRVAGFRMKVLVGMMLVVSAITGLGLYFAERNLAANVAQDLQRQFRSELEALHNAQEIRDTALAERCRALVRKPRIHAALEDGALDLLYPSAEGDLSDVMLRTTDQRDDGLGHALHAEFYRFLAPNGAVIPAPNTRTVGVLTQDEEQRLALPGAPDKQQTGYLVGTHGDARAIFEIITTPIVSTETGELVAALAIGFKPFELDAKDAAGNGVKSGIWLDGRLYGTGLSDAAASGLAADVGAAIAQANKAEDRLRVVIDGMPHQVFYKRLNPGSLFSPAYEVVVYSLTEFRARERQLRWQIVGTGVLLLFGGLIASHFVAGRLSVPVEKLAVESEAEHAQRVRAETQLELTHEELQRSARFSADASHQLKTPVAVLRAGLEELMARENLTPDECDQISALIHQTFRLSSLIEDLLLLSRMDAGRLKLEFAPVNLSQLIEAALDDLGALPNEFELQIETDFPTDLHIAGEKRYTTIILQNLFENARKYNYRRGQIRIAARREGDAVFLIVGNTGKPISPEARAHIFERFHRGAIGENVPGYGLGLNLARELARLHGGDLRLAQSDVEWTEFEVRFQFSEPEAQA